MSKRTFRLSDSRPDAKRDVDDEIAFHLEMRTREFIDQGFGPEEARRRAAATFGDVTSIRSDLSHDRADRNQERARREHWHGIRMDLLYSLRTLKKNPGFAAAAIATLALGFGAALAVFTVVNGVLVRPLPYKDPAGLAMIWVVNQGPDGDSGNLPLSSGFYNDLERDARSFAAIAAFRGWSYSIESGGTEPEPLASARVSPSLFEVLGVRPFIGTTFTRDAAVVGGPREALISYPLWQRRFGGDASVVGKQVMLSGQSFTLVGIMPPGFAFPRGAELPAPLRFGARTELWVPLVFDSTDRVNYSVQNLSAVARYGASQQASQTEVSRLLRQFLDANAPLVKLDYRLVPLAQQAGTQVRRGLFILLGAVACLLLIACANVASLLVARAGNRRRELAVRAALGAGRARVARQLITENIVLAAVGGALGILISAWATRVMLALVPGSMPRADDIGLDWRVITSAALMVIVAGVVFGIATALSVKWTRLAGELHSGGTRMTGHGRHRWGRQLLVSAEVALSLMLLITAALLARSFVNLQRVRPGFDATNVLTAGVSLPIPGRFNPVADGPFWARTLGELTSRLNSARGIVAAGAISSLPLTGATEGGGFRVAGRPPDTPGQGPHAQYNVVSGEYFRAMGLSVVSGRAFDASDDIEGATSVIVNRELVRRYLGDDGNVIGRVITPTFTFGAFRPFTIVGVVDNVKQMSLDDDATPQVYVPQSQMAYPGLTYVLRVDGDPAAALPILRREIQAVSSSLSLTEVQPMTDIVERSLARQRFSLTLIGVFAAAALTLAIVGLYGVVALIVGQRRREIGVRLALGARPIDVVRMVILEGSRLSVVGVVVGIAASVAATRILGAFLYDVSATDALTFAGAALLVIAVSTAATLVPARRASHVNPTAALNVD